MASWPGAGRWRREHFAFSLRATPCSGRHSNRGGACGLPKLKQGGCKLQPQAGPKLTWYGSPFLSPHFMLKPWENRQMANALSPEEKGISVSPDWLELWLRWKKWGWGDKIKRKKDKSPLLFISMFIILDLQPCGVRSIFTRHNC